MRRYLATLHERPDHHKRRFALLVSGSFTLLVFALWCFVRLGAGTPSNTANASASDTVTPFEAVIGNVHDAWKSITGQYNNTQVNTVNQDSSTNNGQ